MREYIMRSLIKETMSRSPDFAMVDLGNPQRAVRTALGWASSTRPPQMMMRIKNRASLSVSVFSFSTGRPPFFST
jgi:hypothetical protein